MYTVEVLEIRTNRVFTKQFSSPYLAEQFVNKVKHSKKLKVVSTSGFY